MLRSASSHSLRTATHATEQRTVVEPAPRSALNRSPSHLALAGLLISAAPTPLVFPLPGEQQLATPEQANRLERCLELETLQPLQAGRSKPDSTRKAIGDAQRKRWAENPQLREQVAAKNRGKEPWNKGKKLGAATRQKMAVAKLGTTIPRATKVKMSRAARGRSHTVETAALLSQKLTGRPKTPQHRAAIAAAQRKRHAAARVLRAVEDVHRQTQAEGSLGTPRLPLSTAAVAAKKGRGRPRKLTTAALANLDSIAPKQQLLEVYKMQLREYRALQDELAPWVRAFEQQSGRKPKLADVEATKIDWLLEKYKKYVVLRERVLKDTTNLRGMLVPDRPTDKSGSSRAATATSTDANNPASRLTAAKAYKAHREHAAASTEDVAALPQPEVLDSAPPRVKVAMTAAMEYRRKKAAATAATANAAAVAAELLPETTKQPANVGAEALRQVLAAQQAAAQAVDDAQSAELSVRKALQQITLNAADEQMATSV